MNDFDRLVVEALIRSRVGEPDTIDLVGRRIRTPMTAFLEVAERAAGSYRYRGSRAGSSAARPRAATRPAR
jgi:hypothetical protein